MNKMYIFFFKLIWGMLIVSALVFQWQLSRETSIKKLDYIVIGEQYWAIEGPLTTVEDRSRGLAYRPSFPQKRGMLFLFDISDRHSFWMKGMQFPIDIIFIRDSVVDSVVMNRQPNDLNPVSPQYPVNAVLEVNAGEAWDVRPGDRVEIVRQ